MPKREQHTYIVPKFPNLYMECGRTGHHNYTCIHQCRWGECVEKYKECSKLAHKTIQNRVVSNLIFGGIFIALAIFWAESPILGDLSWAIHLNIWLGQHFIRPMFLFCVFCVAFFIFNIWRHAFPLGITKHFKIPFLLCCWFLSV